MDMAAEHSGGNGVGSCDGRRGVRDDRGQSLVEFALASVLFLMTLFGTIEFGRAIWQYNMMSDLAQEGARWAAVHGVNSLAPASTADVQNYLNTRGLGFTFTVTTTPTPSTIGQGSTITVQVSSSFTPITGLIPQATLPLQSTATMIMQR
jgi:Flp pilus assembly protein TadG